MTRSSEITSSCVCAGGQRRGTWGSGSGGGRPWRHTGRILNSCQSNRHLNIHALSQKTAFGFISSNSWRFISHLLSRQIGQILKRVFFLFCFHFEALFNCIMTIMNVSSNSSLISECCLCESLDNNHCTSTPCGFYFNSSLLAFPPAVFISPHRWRRIDLFYVLRCYVLNHSILKYCNKSSSKSHRYICEISPHDRFLQKINYWLP